MVWKWAPDYKLSGWKTRSFYFRVKRWNLHKNVHNSDSEFSGLMTVKKDLLIYSSKWNKLKQKGVKRVFSFWESYFLTDFKQQSEELLVWVQIKTESLAQNFLINTHLPQSRVGVWQHECVLSVTRPKSDCWPVCVCVLCYRIQCYLLPGWSLEAGLNPC